MLERADIGEETGTMGSTVSCCVLCTLRGGRDRRSSESVRSVSVCRGGRFGFDFSYLFCTLTLLVELMGSSGSKLG